MASVRIARSYSVDVAHQEVSPASSPYHGPAFHTSIKEKDHSSVMVTAGCFLHWCDHLCVVLISGT